MAKTQFWRCGFCVLYFIAFLCDLVTVTRNEHTPPCLGLISFLFKGNKWQKASVSNYSCYLFRIVGFPCTESMRVIGYGYFLAFPAIFLTVLFNVYINTPMLCFILLLFIFELYISTEVKETKDYERSK